MSADYQKLQAVFLAAVEEHPPGEWDTYLDQACAGDGELRREVGLLLKAHAEGGSLFESDTPTGAYAPVAEGPGEMVGPYRLLEQIGEGGMGAVWMARQTEPVQRLVALKVIRP